MALKRLTPLLWTEKLEETIDFYSTTLGFACRNRNEAWGWAALQNGDVDIMLAKPNEHTIFDKPTFTGSFYFYTDQVEALWSELKDKVKIAYPIETFEWEMKEFAIYDNNGYLLQFGQDVSESSNQKGV